MTRRFEAYHTKLKNASGGGGGGAVSIHELVRSKEDGLAARLVVDPYRRVSLLDHFLPLDESLTRFATASYRELGDFLEAPYESSWKKDPATGDLLLAFQRQGWLQQDAGRTAVGLEKLVRVKSKGGEIRVSYKVFNRGERSINAVFGAEFNFGLLAGNAPDRYWEFKGQRKVGSTLTSVFDEPEARDYSLVDEWLDLKVHFSLSSGAGLWAFPVETVSQSEGGFERSYQNTLLLPHWELNLQPGGTLEFELGVSLEGFRKAGG
jgi:4-alpha-glucanotransferase